MTNPLNYRDKIWKNLKVKILLESKNLAAMHPLDREFAIALMDEKVKADFNLGCFDGDE